MTRDGRPVAELRPTRRRALPLAVLVERWGRLSAVDERRLRADVDAIVDPAL